MRPSRLEEAAEITAAARAQQLAAIDWCGGIYSSEWGLAKLLHWLRAQPRKARALRHGPGTLRHGRRRSLRHHRSRQRPAQRLRHGPQMDVERRARRAAIRRVPHARRSAARRRPRQDWPASTRRRTASPATSRREWAAKLGLRARHSDPDGAFDAHWDAVGAGVRLGDVVNVVGTSTCIIAIGEKPNLVPGVCGVVPGSVDPARTGIEAGLSATGDIFEAIARRAGSHASPSSREGLENYRAGETGLLRLTWDNGDRTVLVNPELSGVTLGWRLTHTAQDELFAAIEGTAFHTRVILERMEEHGVPVHRIINGGGIPQKNEVLNQVYANVLGKPILVPKGDVTSLGSAIFAFLAAGAFPSIEDAQDALCPGHRVVEPDPAEAAVYEQLYPLYRKLYFAFGERQSDPAAIGDVLPELRRIAAQVARRQECWTRCELKSSKPTSNWCAAAWCCTPSATPAPSRARRA